jgi:hypothetical protein
MTSCWLTFKMALWHNSAGEPAPSDATGAEELTFAGAAAELAKVRAAFTPIARRATGLIILAAGAAAESMVFVGQRWMLSLGISVYFTRPPFRRVPYV